MKNNFNYLNEEYKKSKTKIKEIKIYLKNIKIKMKKYNY